MATDSRSIFYSPDYVTTLSEAECIGVIAHEISTIVVLRHFQRQGDIERLLWNMACDYELNPGSDTSRLDVPQGLLIDARFNGLSAEQIYNVIAPRE